MYFFNREGTEIKDWKKNNEKLMDNLEELSNDNCSKEEMKSFLQMAVCYVESAEAEDVFFWAYDHPDLMPSDARCEFVYKPTYLMTLAMVNIINKAPALMTVGVRKTLQYSLNACAARGLCGDNGESYKGLCDNVLLFMKNGIVKFMKDWPLLSVQFEGVIRNALNQIERDYNAGNHAFEAGKACKDIYEKIIRLRNDAVQQ